MTEQELERFINELLDEDSLPMMRSVLSALWYGDLEAVHEAVFDQCAYELAFGALERSAWLCDNVIVNANQGAICRSQTALDAVRTEMDERKALAADEPATGLLN